MIPFKFFQKKPLIEAHDGGYIYPDEVFYIMNKEDMESKTGKRLIPKYTIVRRIVRKEYEDMYKPDYDRKWYFKSRENAEYLRDIWEREDRLGL